jgi:serine/threonine protein kinase
MDLTPYGLDIKLHSELVNVPESFVGKVCNVVVDGKYLFFRKHDGSEIRIKLNKSVSSGSFGSVWDTRTVLDSDKTPLIVKKIPIAENAINSRAELLFDAFKEMLIQIIIYDFTKDLLFRELQLFGPFAPKFFLAGCDNEFFYIVSQNMFHTVLDNFQTNKTAKNIRDMTLQLCKILEVLYNGLGFNHRDLKLDNIAVEYSPKFGSNVRLIDFGFSCLRFNNLQIHPTAKERNHEFSHCLSRCRDLHSYFYYLINVSEIFNDVFVYANLCDIHRVIKSLLGSDQRVARSYNETFDLYDVMNSHENPLRAENLDFIVVYNVFFSLYFRNDNSLCTLINNDWTGHLARLYNSTIEHLHYVEYEQVRDHVISRKILDDISKGSGSFSVNAFNKFHMTALMDAARICNVELVERLLVFKNIKTALQDNDGNTALHYVAMSCSAVNKQEALRIIDLLIRRNPALPDIKNRFNRGPANRHVCSDPEIQVSIKRHKSLLPFWPHKNTDKHNGGGKRKTMKKYTREMYVI